MATVTKGRTFVSGEVVTPTKLNTLVDSATVTNIVNADIDASAAIADTKLSTIATAGKVSNSATTATSANTASTIVARDASGNFSAATITASLTGNVTGNVTGNATTATTLQTARTVAISGDVTGTATSFNGSANISIASAITADSIVNADINSAAAIADTKLATISTAGKVSNSATTATNANTSSAIVARDASGNFSAGTITAALNGSANAIADGVVSTTAKLANGIVTAVKLGNTERLQICKAWVNFNGSTGAIRSSHNVSSITKNGTGNYTVNFATAMADANYSVVTTTRQDTDANENAYSSHVAKGGTISTTAVQVVHGYYVSGNTYIDASYFNVTIFGN